MSIKLALNQLTANVFIVEDVDLSTGGGAKTRTYLPKNVYKLAHLRREDGGGGKLSRTNSDSYVQLINGKLIDIQLPPLPSGSTHSIVLLLYP